MINSGKIENIYGPISLTFIVPLILFTILIKTNKISNNNFPNKNGLIMFFTLLVYGFISIKVSKKKFTGPTNVDNITPEYAANGFEFWIFTVFLTILLSDIFPDIPKVFSKNFIPFIMIANIFGLFFVTYLYFRSKDNYYDKENDDKKKRSKLFRFFRGFEHHPRLFGVDIKQWTNCRFGMISWQIIILLFMFYYFNKHGFNTGIFVTVLLQSIYIGKFFYWETGYFNTLDITLDRAGYYICWGCLVFLPSLYTYSTYYLINQKGDISKKVGLIILLLGIIFTYKNYDVDRQKEIFKKDKENSIINGKKAKYMNVKYKKNGEEVDSKLLLSGDWGITRHNNYTYEILTAAMWSAPGYKYGIMPFLYLIYIIILLVHRIYRDEDKCKKKYGKYWDEYCNIVKYRLIKGIY